MYTENLAGKESTRRHQGDTSLICVDALYEEVETLERFRLHSRERERHV